MIVSRMANFDDCDHAVQAYAKCRKGKVFRETCFMLVKGVEKDDASRGDRNRVGVSVTAPSGVAEFLCGRHP